MQELVRLTYQRDRFLRRVRLWCAVLECYWLRGWVRDIGYFGYPSSPHPYWVQAPKFRQSQLPNQGRPHLSEQSVLVFHDPIRGSEIESDQWSAVRDQPAASRVDHRGPDIEWVLPTASCHSRKDEPWPALWRLQQVLSKYHRHERYIFALKFKYHPVLPGDFYPALEIHDSKYCKFFKPFSKSILYSMCSRTLLKELISTKLYFLVLSFLWTRAKRTPPKVTWCTWRSSCFWRSQLLESSRWALTHLSTWRSNWILLSWRARVILTLIWYLSPCTVLLRTDQDYLSQFTSQLSQFCPILPLTQNACAKKDAMDWCTLFKFSRTTGS